MRASTVAMKGLTRDSLMLAVQALTARDRGLAAIVERHGPPPLWTRRPGFVTLGRIILEQQVSLAAAATLFKRLAKQIPGGFTSGAISATGVDGLRALGVTRQKASYLVTLATRIESGVLDLRSLSMLSDHDASARLQELPGIGPWTAQVYLLVALRRPDIWPSGDLALHKAMVPLRRPARVPTSDEAVQHATRWAPHRAVAARILWHGYLSERAR